MNKNNLKNLSILIVLFIVLFSSTYILIDRYKEERIKAVLDTHTNKIETYYEILSYNQKNMANEIYKKTISNKEVIDILKQANKLKNNKKQLNIIREKLYDLLKNDYQIYKDKGIIQFQFVLPNNISFLRVHKLNKYGDNLSDVRVDFKKVNKTLKTVRGFAQGKTSHSFRNVYPLFDEKDNHIGAVEISFSSELLQSYFTNINKIHTHFLVKKDIFKVKAWNRETVQFYYRASAEHKDYMITMTKEHTNKLCIIENGKKLEANKEKISNLMKKEQKFSVYDILDDKIRIVSFYPILHNTTDEVSAWIVSYIDDTLIQKTIQSAYILNISSFIILLIISIFIYILLEQKIKVDNLLKQQNLNLQNLNENKKFTDSILDNTAHAIIATNLDGIITLFNKSAQEMFGYKKDDIIGKKTPDIFYEEKEIILKTKKYSKELNLELKTGFDTLVAKTKQGLQNDDEWRFIDSNKKEFFVSLHITALTTVDGNINGYLGIAQDITQSKEKEKQIQEYIRLVDNNIITSSTDLDGNITYVSEAFCKISGHTREELLGKNHRIIKSIDMGASVYENIWNTIKNNGTWKGEIKNQAKNGDIYWVKASISPIFNSLGEKIGYTAIRENITDKKLIEEISITDALTNIYNRRHFNDIFPKIIKNSKTNNELVSFLIMDIDHFKQYNDTYGHQMGDDVLIKVAKAIKDSIYQDTDYCFRLGGEEFGVVFKTDSKQKGLEFANTIKENIENLHIIHEKNSASSYITASMGLICKNAQDIQSDDEVYKQSDDLLYEAKESGRNKVIVNL